MQWCIETSHMVAVPESIEADDLPELRRQVQQIADSKVARPESPAIGELSFKYELDDQDEPVVVHSFFMNRHGKKARFMRLRRLN